MRKDAAKIAEAIIKTRGIKYYHELTGGRTKKAESYDEAHAMIVESLNAMEEGQYNKIKHLFL